MEWTAKPGFADTLWRLEGISGQCMKLTDIFNKSQVPVNILYKSAHKPLAAWSGKDLTMVSSTRYLIPFSYIDHYNILMNKRYHCSVSHNLQRSFNTKIGFSKPVKGNLIWCTLFHVQTGFCISEEKKTPTQLISMTIIYYSRNPAYIGVDLPST